MYNVFYIVYKISTKLHSLTTVRDIILFFNPYKKSQVILFRLVFFRWILFSFVYFLKRIRKIGFWWHEKWILKLLLCSYSTVLHSLSHSLLLWNFFMSPALLIVLSRFWKIICLHGLYYLLQMMCFYLNQGDLEHFFFCILFNVYIVPIFQILVNVCNMCYAYKYIE